MTDLSHAAVTGDLVEDTTDFFASVSDDVVDGLIGSYQAERQRIEYLHEMMTGGGYSGALWHFMEANTSDQRRYYTTNIENLMKLEPAIASLNASYWGRALALILPASAKGKDLLPGFDHEWSSVIDNAFAGGQRVRGDAEGHDAMSCAWCLLDVLLTGR